MGIKVQRKVILVLLSALCGMVSLSAQEQRDSLVRLVKGSTLRLIEDGSSNYRQATDATFLHNGTYLICDTAYWYVDSKLIDAFGNVKMVQDETILTSEHLNYFIDRDMARFSGGVVQLRDKGGNTLRTYTLDYNTKDSVAVFDGGAALKSKDGQIIESTKGTYETRRELFTFEDNVNMFTDSIFIKTTGMLYDSRENRAIFTEPIDFWKDRNMLSADGGWYHRPSETFFFKDRVHALTSEQESWSDTLYYYRNSNDVLLLGNAQVQDTTRNMSAVADHIHYCDTNSTLTLMRNAAVALATRPDSSSVIDTIYCGGDLIVYRTIKKCDISEGEIKAAEGRLEEISTDPVGEYRRKAAEEAAKAAAAAAEADPLREDMIDRGAAGAIERRKRLEAIAAKKEAAAETPADAPEETPEETPEEAPVVAPADTLSARLDSTLSVGLDSLAASADSVVVLPDTTKIGFLTATGEVRVFKRDIQVLCDSLLYCDLDSIARLYINPIVWNEGNRQYSSDSITLLVSGGRVTKANLMSNAFVITEEDPLHYDQIRSTEMMAYFDSTMALSRYDALGGVDALFYLQEKGEFATVNKVKTKMMSAFFQNGEINRVHYFDSPANDAYPTAQLPRGEEKMKGFNWNTGKRPASRYDVTPLQIRKSFRNFYMRRPRTTFRQTDRFFPGYMKGVYREIAVRDSIRKWEELHPAKPDTVAADSPVAMADSLESVAPVDTLKSVHSEEVGSPAPVAASDSLQAPKDSTVSVADSVRVLTAKEIRAQERKARADSLEARRQARWAELDARDAAKAEAKRQKQLARQREKTRKLWLEAQKQKRADEEKLQQYISKFEKQKSRKYGRKNSAEVPALREDRHEVGRELTVTTVKSESVGSVEASE